MEKINTFDDWVDYFKKWQKDIGFDPALVPDYKFEAFYEDPPESEVEFGEFAGQKKWDRLLQVPTQDMRDALLHLVYYQGDTEFASSEQQRGLIAKAPSPYDLKCLLRVMREEMRHGWQMAYVLVTHFGDSGKAQAQRLLERRANENTRLLDSFNQPVRNWLDFFTYTSFIDRDGKYQLNMLSRSAFAPLGRSTLPMLQEEAYHLAQGNIGLMRIVKAGKIPTTIMQKYFNKWISTAYDLFGQDESSSAHWAYVWGLKGRYDEHLYDQPADMDRLNELSRSTFFKEVSALVDALNHNVPKDQPRLTIPNDKFRRHIGAYAGKTYSVAGELLSQEAYDKHLQEVMPSEADDQFVIGLEKDTDWIIASTQK